MVEKWVGNSGDVYEIRGDLVYRIWPDGLEGLTCYDPDVIRGLCRKLIYH